MLKQDSLNYSRYNFLDGLTKRKSVRIFAVMAEIRLGQLRNMTQKRDRYANPLDDKRFYGLISSVTQFRYNPDIFHVHYKLF
jgi:hypothetical protein